MQHGLPLPIVIFLMAHAALAQQALAQQAAMVWQFESKSSVYCLDFSPDDTNLAIAYRSGRIELRDVVSSSVAANTLHKEGAVVDLEFHPDGSLIAALDTHETITFWSRSLQSKSVQFKHPKASCFDISSDGKSLLVGGTGTLDLIDMTDTSKVITVKRDVSTRSVALSPDGKRIACGRFPDVIEVFDVATLAEVFKLERHRRCFPYIAFSPDGKTLAIGGHNEVLLKSIDTPMEPIRLHAELHGVSEIRFSPTGDVLAAIDYDSTTLWSLASQTVLVTIPHQLDSKNRSSVSMAFSHNGKNIALSNLNGVSMWKLP